jgi:hypothetical protein
MNCGQAHRLFGACWDDELTQAERECLEGHFSACVSCRGEYELLARTLELAGSLPRVEVRPGLAERALAKARRAAPVADHVAAGGSRRWVAVTALGALLAVAGTMVAQWSGIDLAPQRVASVPLQTQVLQGPPQPVVRSGQEDPEAASAADLALQASAEVPDSLFDRGEDIEFILDPVTLRKGRAHPRPRLTPEVQAAQAVITF